MGNKTAEAQMLDNIFEIMQQLYNEMRLNKYESNHLKVFEIFAELGRTLKFLAVG